MLDHKSAAKALKANYPIFEGLFYSFPMDHRLWKPAPDKWNMLEIVSHLYDEERFDFRARCMKILDGDADWKAIDPEGWVTSHDYSNNNFEDTVKKFIEERKSSLEWLKEKENSDWNMKIKKEKLGDISANQMLNLWLGHDLLHIRQIVRLKWLYLEKDTDLRYAGEW